MLKVTPSYDRLRALALFMEERVDIRLDMNNRRHCAHKFACIRFGFQEAAGEPTRELAWMLQISLVDAADIYTSSTLERPQIVSLLRSMADKYELA